MAPVAIDWLAGLTLIDKSPAGFTVSVVDPLSPLELAVIVLLPTPTPVARPPLDMVAIPAVELQLTAVVRFLVVPSL